MRLLIALLKDRTAATAVEYGLLTALIASAMVGGLKAFSNSEVNMFNLVINTIEMAD